MINYQFDTPNYYFILRKKKKKNCQADSVVFGLRISKTIKRLQNCREMALRLIISCKGSQFRLLYFSDPHSSSSDKVPSGLPSSSNNPLSQVYTIKSLILSRRNSATILSSQPSLFRRLDGLGFGSFSSTNSLCQIIKHAECSSPKSLFIAISCWLGVSR